MTTERFSPVAPTEEKVLTFPFAKELAEGETLSDPAVAVTVGRGTDPAPAAIIQSAQAVGTDVLVAVHNLAQDVDYRITVTCATSNPLNTPTLAGILPCRRA